MKKYTNQKGFSNSILVAAGGVLLVAGIGAYFLLNQSRTKSTVMTDETQTATQPVTQDSSGMEEMKEMAVENYQFMGELVDVAGGSSSGLAMAGFENGTYVLLATFMGLPELDEGFFYEGWVVSSSPLDPVSTGAVEMMAGVYTNSFTANQDLTDHSQYVLTLEPDDGDPAPADHVLEGTLTKN